MKGFTTNFMDLIRGIKTNRFKKHIYTVLALAFIGVFATYFFLYRYSDDPEQIEPAIVSEIRVDIELISIEKEGKDLYAFFKIDGVGSECEVGFAWYRQGMTGKYRYIGTKRQIIPYESIIMIWPRDDKRGGNYYVGGYNCSAIEEFGIEIRDKNTYDLYSVTKFQVPANEFIMTVDETDLLSDYTPGEDEDPIVWLLPAYYDETGADITETLRIESESSRSVSRFSSPWLLIIFVGFGIFGATVAVIFPLLLAGEVLGGEEK